MAQIIVSIMVIQVVVTQTGFGVLYTLSEVVRQLRVQQVYQKVINESNSKRRYLNFITLMLATIPIHKSKIVYERILQQGTTMKNDGDLPGIKSHYIMILT